MKISLDLIQTLRKKTGVGISDCKKALEQAQGDLDAAEKILRKKGEKIIASKSDRIAREGVIGCYVHHNGKAGAIVQVYCETDFVARNADFKQLAQDIAMQLVACRAEYIKPEDVPAEKITAEKALILEQMQGEKKPAAILEKIIAGKIQKFCLDQSLIHQPFFKNPEITISDLIAEKTLKLGEKIEIGEFKILEL